MSRIVRVMTGVQQVGSWRLGVCGLALTWVVLLTPTVGFIQAAGQQSPSTASPAVSPQRALLNQYCVACHNQRQKAAGATPIALDTLDVTKVGSDGESWEKVVLKLRAGLMPPAGRPRPDRASHDAFAGWLEGELDRAAVANPNPGRTEAFHRLNRAEYQNVIRDLLDVEVDVASLLPSDDVSAGFDNIASVMTVSPTLMDRYLAAAQKVARLAIGTPAPLPNVDYFRVTDDLPQDDHLPGLPFGTRGGTRISYTFPRDGEYVIKVRLARDLNDGMPAYADPQQLEVSLDGVRLQVFTLPGVQPPAPRGQRPPPGQQPQVRPPQEEQQPETAPAERDPQQPRPPQPQRGAQPPAGTGRRPHASCGIAPTRTGTSACPCGRVSVRSRSRS